LHGVAGDLFTGDKGAFAGADLGGNLGGGVLRRFTVAFDYAGRTMYLAPNEAFAQADAFDRSGLWLLGAADALEVVDVAAGSAAQQAGLRVGDRITAIDGAVAAWARLPAVRERLRESAAGTPLA